MYVKTLRRATQNKQICLCGNKNIIHLFIKIISLVMNIFITEQSIKNKLNRIKYEIISGFSRMYQEQTVNSN